MIKLSRMSDYAVVVLGVIHKSPTDSLSASQIALASLLPEPTVAKVLKLMAMGGLVTSQRGVNGGYALTRTPLDMTVYDIVTAIEGRVALTACVDGGEDTPCALEKHCTMSGRWDRVNEAVRVAFQSVTLADMLAYVPTMRVMAPQPAAAIEVA